MKYLKKIIKYLLILLFVAAIIDGLFFNVVVPFFNKKQLITDVQKSVVKIKVVYEDGDIENGSGFIIRNDGIIVTNDHVLGNHRKIIDKIQVSLNDNRIYNLSDIGILYRNEIQDIAILKVRDNYLPYLHIGNKTKYLQKTFVIGYPAGKISFAEGRISANNEIILDDFSFIQMNTELDPGFSGSPVVNRKGQVIGIATVKIGNNLNFAVPVRYVKCVLDNINEEIVLFENNLGNILFEDTNNTDWVQIIGDWSRYGRSIVNISKISEPFQFGAEGLVIYNNECGNFILESNMLCIARFDGYQNTDMGVVFRYHNRNNFLIFSTYSEKTWYKDKGGLWKITMGNWELLQSSNLIQPFKTNRWYNIKIKANENNIQVYIDNIKCINYEDSFSQSGNVGFRTVSSHSWFENLKVYNLND